MVNLISASELNERAYAIRLMFKGLAKRSDVRYNSKTKKMEVDVCIQNKESRSIFISMDMDHKGNMDIEFNVDCMEDNVINAEKYIESIPKDVFTKRGWSEDIGNFYVKVYQGKIYWGIDIKTKFIDSRNQDRLMNLFKDVLEVIGEFLYIKNYSKVS